MSFPRIWHIAWHVLLLNRIPICRRPDFSLVENIPEMFDHYIEFITGVMRTEDITGRLKSSLEAIDAIS